MEPRPDHRGQPSRRREGLNPLQRRMESRPTNIMHLWRDNRQAWCAENTASHYLTTTSTDVAEGVRKPQSTRRADPPKRYPIRIATRCGTTRSRFANLRASPPAVPLCELEPARAGAGSATRCATWPSGRVPHGASRRFRKSQRLATTFGGICERARPELGAQAGEWLASRTASGRNGLPATEHRQLRHGLRAGGPPTGSCRRTPKFPQG